MEAGCEVIDGVVDKVDKESDRGGFVLELADGGAVVRADKVIMATGSNANLRPSLKVKSQSHLCLATRIRGNLSLLPSVNAMT